ncbi:hypothetical protein Tco_0877945 [Tanacetum coccineum]|uniref:Uncharacterized protein n=1 Tax=Tanacetum coccineum TaxID=301880 RepID=A0ABQ5C2C3_9ASTR
MHNNIMAAGSKERPPMPGPGRYSQWHSPVEAAENILPVAAHEEQRRMWTAIGRLTTWESLERTKISASAKPRHMIAPSSSRYSSNDMVPHNHLLEEAKKRPWNTQRIPRNFSDSQTFCLLDGKSISSTEATEEEAARQVHATHVRIKTKSEPEPTKKKTSSRSTRGVVIQDPPNTMQALKESKKTSRRQLGTRGSNEGTGVSPGVLDESTVVPATSSEGNESEYSEEDQGDNEEVNWIDSDEDEEKKDDTDDDKSIDLEMTDDENGDEENTNSAKTDAGKTEEVKDNAKKAELPPTSSSLSVSLGFGDQFLKLSSNTSLVSTVKDTTDAEINSLLDIKIQSEVPHIQSPSVLTVPISVISKPVVLIPILVTPLVDSATTLLTPSSVSTIPPKSASEILKIKKEQDEKQKMPRYTIKSTDKAALKEYDQKRTLYQTMHENKSFNRNPANHRLYYALMEALIEDKNTMDKGVANTVKDNKRKHDDDDDDEDPLAGPNQGKKTKRQRTKESESSKKPSTIKETPKGKAPLKGSKTGKSASTKEPIKEPIAKVVMDDAVNTVGKDVVRDDDQPQDNSEPKTDKTPNPEWFKQPPRPPTPDPEWNKHQVVLGQPEQPWFNQMVSSTKDPLTFNDLIATPIDFSKYALNRLKIDNLTQDLLVGPAYNMLKDTCTNNIQLKYNSQECHLGHLTVVVDYFFNNDLEYLKTSDPEKTYTTSILKTKAAQYEIVGIEDMVPTLWSTIKHAYDKDAAKGSSIGAKGVSFEVVVKRTDRQLYKFKESDFVYLHLNGIEDMLILVVQHKLFHLNESNIIDFIVALRMFTSILIIKRRCYTPPRRKREV